MYALYDWLNPTACPRHLGQANIMWADTHVSSLRSPDSPTFYNAGMLGNPWVPNVGDNLWDR